MGFNPFGGGGVSMGQVDAAIAAALAGVSTLSDYANIVVVDAGGNGDYATLTSAIGGVTAAGTVYLIFGNTTEPAGTLAINRNCKIVGIGGSSITKSSGAISIAPGYSVEFIGELTVTCTTISDAGDLTMACKFLGRIQILSSDGNPVYLRLSRTATVINASGVAIDLIDAGVSGASVLIIDGAVITSSSVAIDIGSNADATELDTANSKIVAARITGVTDAISSDVAISPQVYLCLLDGGVNANVTLPAGGGNVSI